MMNNLHRDELTVKDHGVSVLMEAALSTVTASTGFVTVKMPLKNPYQVIHVFLVFHSMKMLYIVLVPILLLT